MGSAKSTEDSARKRFLPESRAVAQLRHCFSGSIGRVPGRFRRARKYLQSSSEGSGCEIGGVFLSVCVGGH